MSRTVTVTDAKGNPVSEAKVTGIGLSISAVPVYTDENGSAKLPNFPKEIIQVVVDKNGFAQGLAFPPRDFKTVDVMLKPGKDEPVDLRPALSNLLPAQTAK